MYFVSETVQILFMKYVGDEDSARKCQSAFIKHMLHKKEIKSAPAWKWKQSCAAYTW